MLDWIIKGGPVMVPIIAGSVVAVAVFLERLWVLRRRRVVPEAFVAQIEKLLAEDKRGEAEQLCKVAGHAMGRILAVALASAGRPRPRIKEAVEEVGKYEGAQLERYVEVVGTVAAIEPLLGLLGTVFGMIAVFQRIEALGLGNPSAFAAGLWEALITTAAGLAIAIPAYVGYKYLLSRCERLLLEMEERSLAVIDVVSGEPR